MVMKKDRKKSSYYILTRDETLELREQKHRIITNTCVAAGGLLIVAITCLNSEDLWNDSMTVSQFLTLMVGGSASFLGFLSSILSSIEYNNLKDNIYDRAQREGRVRR